MKKNKKKRICFFIGSLDFGGISRVYMNLVPELIKYDDIDIDFFLLKERGEFLNEVPPGVRVFISEGSTVKRIFNYISYLLREKPALSISTYQRLDIINILSCFFVFFRTRPVVTVHTNLSIEIKSKTNNSPFYPILSRILYKFPNKFIAVSEGVKSDFCERTKVKPAEVVVIYNPVTPYQNEIPTVISPLFNILKEKKEKYIITAGRFSEAKDYFTLLKAFEIVRKNKEINLVLLGDGHLRSEIEKTISDLKLNNCVYLFGYVDKPQFYIKDAELFVLSSKWEGFSIVLVEAMGVGIPIVSTDCPSGPKEILNNGEFGKLVPVENPKKLAKGILESLENPIAKDLLIQRSLDFHPQKTAEEYYNYLFLKK